MVTREIYWAIPGHEWMYLPAAVATAVFLYGMWARLHLIRLGTQGSLAASGMGPNPSPRGRRAAAAAVLDGLLREPHAPVHPLGDADPGLRDRHGAAEGRPRPAGLPGRLLPVVVAGPRRARTGGHRRRRHGSGAPLRHAAAEARQPRRRRCSSSAACWWCSSWGSSSKACAWPPSRTPGAAWSPVGWALVARRSRACRVGALETTYQVLWWFHLLTACALIAAIPFTKLLHMATAPANQMSAADRTAKGALTPIDFTDETKELYGLGDVAELDRRARLSLEACTRCGRCQDVCPAYASGKSLTPKQVILDLRRWLEDAQLKRATGSLRRSARSRNPGRRRPGRRGRLRAELHRARR